MFIPEDYPSEKVQFAAVKQEGAYISYINNPTKYVQHEAVRQNIDNIFYIKNPDPNVVFYCMASDPELLKNEKERREKIPFYKDLPENYFQHLSLEVQKMLVKYDVAFTLIIPNLHPKLKTKLTNVRNIGLI